MQLSSHVEAQRSSSRHGLTGILRQLLQAGADHTAVTGEGHTPLALARGADQLAAVALLEAWATTGSLDDVRDPTQEGMTEEEAMLMAELEEMEVKPTVISSGPLPGKKKKAGPRVCEIHPADSH